MATGTNTTERRSRRTILAGALGGLAGLIAGRAATPDAASAASGDPLILGNLANNAGTEGTKLSTSSTDTALYVQQSGTGAALRGVANNGIAGFFTSANGTGISGVTAKNNQFGVYGGNDAGTFGGGEGIRANGQQNHGLVATTANASAYGVKAVNSGLDGRAILGQAPATTGSSGIGVVGQADGEFGSGVHGLATSASGTPNGVRGVAGAPNGSGVYGQQTAGTFDDGAAVRADGGQNHGVVAATSYAHAYAVKATTSAVDGMAVLAQATATSGSNNAVVGRIYGNGTAVFGLAATLGLGESRGVWGLAAGEIGIGVYGNAASLTGTTYGVSGAVESPTGTGVSGNSLATTGVSYGVRGQTASSTGYGVSGISLATTGVNYGVRGQTASSTGYGVYSSGNAHVQGALSVSSNLTVTGAITAGTKDFRIDHPLDPAQKFLSHSCVESDARRTVYDGEVTLDAKGEATVVLPNWFGALNGHTRIQLTPIGAGAPDLHLKAKVADNRFAIAGGAAGQEVYWQLTGIRQDAYAKAHPLAVEATKTGTERGRYLHPEVYGKPASNSIDALHARPAPAAAPAHAPAPASGH
jgi:hypothetical protein